MKSKQVALALIQNSNKEILLTQRYDPEVPEAHLKWDLVGGKIEENENGEETVIRECIEEVGCDIQVINKLEEEVKKIWNTDNGLLEINLICYNCTLLHHNEDCELDRKISDVKWVSIEDIRNYDLIETIKPFINNYEAN